VLPGGPVVGIDIQSRMIDRLKARAAAANITNLTTILGDATQPIVPEASFDVANMAAALGEIPDRAAALAQCFRALRSGGVLSISETQPDPHYQAKATIKRLAEAAGFELQSIQGGMWLYTANFIKP
jgi:ubiquinone/menaquinone biosynthesis C-methylase UbiE